MFVRSFRWVRRLLYLVVVAAVVYLVVTAVQVAAASHESSGLPSIKTDPVIVVIGSPTTGSISADLEQRCALALALYSDHHAKTVITTGASSAAGSPAEAAVAAGWLAKHHVEDVAKLPVSPIVDQLEKIAAMLTADQRRHVVLIADPLQTKYLQGAAAAVGLTTVVAAAPAPGQGLWGDARTIWSQSLAVGSGRIFGYKNTGWLAG